MADVLTPAQSPSAVLNGEPSISIADILRVAQMITGTASPATPADDEEAKQAQAYYQQNQAYVRPGDHVYNTPLPPEEEAKFRQWVSANKVPFDVSAPVSDYDMRGFWRALQAGDPVAKTAINPNDQEMHYPDYWKTPYDESFSAESQWADPKKAPKWNDQDQLVLPNGTVVFDERKTVKAGGRAG